MAQQWRPWLPEAALAQLDLAERLRAVVRDWSERWWAAGEMGLCDTPSRRKASWLDQYCWQAGEGCAISVRPDLLLAGLLDRAIPAGARTDADEMLLAELVDGAVADLGGRLLTMLKLQPAKVFRQGTQSEDPFARTWRCGIGIAAPSVIELAIDEDLLIGLIKAELPPAPASAPPVGMADPIARQRVLLAVDLGTVPLALQDLRDLTVGDVLILDRAIVDPLPIAILGGVATSACGHLEKEDDRLMLRIAGQD